MKTSQAEISIPKSAIPTPIMITSLKSSVIFTFNMCFRVTLLLGYTRTAYPSETSPSLLRDEVQIIQCDFVREDPRPADRGVEKCFALGGPMKTYKIQPRGGSANWRAQRKWTCARDRFESRSGVATSYALWVGLCATLYIYAAYIPLSLKKKGGPGPRGPPCSYAPASTLLVYIYIRTQTPITDPHHKYTTY